MFARHLRQSLPVAAISFKASSAPRRTLFWSSTAPVAATTLAATAIPSVAPSLLFPLLAAILLASDSDDLADDPPWTPTDMSAAGKGIGALASRQLERGELLIAERPLCVWPQGLSPEQAEELFKGLSARQQKVYMELAKTDGKSVAGMSEVLARRATNGFAVALPGSGKVVGMLFPRIARLNHSCSPNASQAFNFVTLRMEVYPIATIPKDAEIVIESSFGFDKCLCPVCTAPPEEIEQSDHRRLEIRSVSEGLIGGRTDRAKTLGSMERIRVLLEEEGYRGLPEFEDPAVSNAYAVYASMHARSQRDATPL